jgi:hypothetical protein
MFWSNREPASDDTSIRNSEPMHRSQSVQAPASVVPFVLVEVAIDPSAPDRLTA